MMKEKNQKGFTVVELLASFTLTMIIVVFLFELLIELKDLYYESGIKTEVVHNQSILINKIHDSLDEYDLIGVDCSGTACTFKFSDTESITLRIDSDNNQVIYGEDKIKFPNEVKFKDYSLTTCKVKDGKADNDLGLLEGTEAKDCYMKLNITISSNRLDKDYGVNMVYPYKYDPNFIVGSLDDGGVETSSTEKFLCGDNGKNKEYTVGQTGTYKIELLGASGGANDTVEGGKGAYTSGEIYLNEGDKFYINVGCAGSKKTDGVTQSVTGGYNGGGNGATMEGVSGYPGGGGGATDIRIKSGTDVASLRSRIMVAAGGSGAGNGKSTKSGTAGGDLISANSSSSNSSAPKGATQISGGKAMSGSNSGSLGVGATATAGGGGGGGYYGGAGGTLITVNGEKSGTSGTGGSSYISGMLGSNSVTSESSSAATNSSIHYSNKFFYNTIMYSGDDVPSDKTSASVYSSTPDGDTTSGDGYAIITYLGSDIPSEASEKAYSSENYTEDDLVLCFDGNNNTGKGIHDFAVNSWHNLKSSSHLTLSNAKWTNDGLRLTTSGSMTFSLNSSFSSSVIFTLDSIPSTTKYVINGSTGIYINSAGKVGFNNGTSNILFDYTVTANIKEYLTIVANGNSVTLYSKDKKVDEKSVTTSSISSATLSLAGSFDGTLHKVMIYNTELSSSDVEELYNVDAYRYAENTTDLKGKIVDFDFSAEDGYKTSSKVVYNIVNYLSSGKVSGDMTISNDSLVLNGSNYIEYSGEVNYRYSVNLILKSASNSGNNPSLIGPSPYPSLYLNSSDGYKYYFNSQGVNSSLGQAFKTGDNQYVTLVYDGSNVILYVNGSKVGSVETTTDPSSLESVKIGNGFVGNLSKAEVYNRSLNSEEVKQLYRTNKMNES